jgi:hypothetical protein
MKLFLLFLFLLFLFLFLFSKAKKKKRFDVFDFMDEKELKKKSERNNTMKPHNSS